MFVVFFVLILNLGISFWNASVVGRYWTERRQLPGWTRFMMWCGAAMSVCGFFYVYMMVLTMIMYDLHLFEMLATALFDVALEPGTVDMLVQNIFNLSYLMVIFPVLGLGLAIWANSLAVAYIRRDWVSIGVAAYNTGAQLHNVVSAARHVPRATGDLLRGLGKGLKGKKTGQALAYLVLLLFPIVISLGSAIATTVVVMRASDVRYELEESAGKSLKA